jgi:hypothetical protein
MIFSCLPLPDDPPGFRRFFHSGSAGGETDGLFRSVSGSLGRSGLKGQDFWRNHPEMGKFFAFQRALHED